MSSQENGSICAVLRCRQCTPAMLTVIVGFAVSAAIFFAAYSWERKSMRREFDSLAEDRFHAINNFFHESAKLINFMDNVFMVGPRADSPEFANYVRSLKTFLEMDLAGHLELHGLVWAPKVPRAERAAYQQAARAVLDPGFQIREPDVAANQESAEPRAACFPSYLCLGATPARGRLGEDMAADPAAWAAMQRACDTGVAVAVAPIKMPVGADDRLGYRVFQPLYSGGDPGNAEARRRASTGFLCIDLNIGELVHNAIKGIQPVGIDVWVDDDTDAKGLTVCRHASRLHSPSPGKGGPDASDELQSTQPADFFGRKLVLRCGATETFWASHTIWQPWVLLGGGLILTLVVASYQLNLALRAIAVERAVTTRMAAFCQEIEHRRR